MEQRISVLLIEDNPGDARLILEILAESRAVSFDATWVDSLDAGVARLRAEPADVVLLDLGLPGSTGMETLDRFFASAPAVPALVVMSGLDDEDVAIKTVQAGAQDYLVKGQTDSALVVRAIRYAIERGQAEAALRKLHAELDQRVRERTAEFACVVEALYAEVAERKKIEEALRASEERFRAIYEDTPSIYLTAGDDGKVLSINRMGLAQLGYSSREVVGHPVSQLFPDIDRQAATMHLAECAMNASQTFQSECRMLRRNGALLWVRQTIRAVRGRDGVAVLLIVCEDITERKQAEDHIHYLAHHDALTGLPNRVLMEDRINQAVAQARRNPQNQVAVLFIDLDYFKHINDSLGHQVGDRLLKAVGQRLQACLREGDSVARLGGDEFVLTLPLSDGHDAAVVAVRVLESLAQPFLVDDNELHVSGSIGISLHPNDGDNAEALMRAADVAMYQAKEKGRSNYQFFTPALDETARQRLHLANQLRHAMAHDGFELYYQPQVDIRNGRIFAAEALLRWRGPNGLISCADFMAVAEDTGLILQLGEWALRQACSQLHTWHQAGYPDLRMAVNISPRQCFQRSFADLVARVLQDTSLPPVALDLEITEGVLMQPSDDNLAILKALELMGVQLSIDDFGTGYSSLAYLRRFPIRTLKIDRSFVEGIGEDTHDAAIVTAIIGMAQTLNLKVIAEGVETQHQLAFLKAQGCQAVQGYYFSRPVPATAFLELLAQSNHMGWAAQ